MKNHRDEGEDESNVCGPHSRGPGTAVPERSVDASAPPARVRKEAVGRGCLIMTVLIMRRKGFPDLKWLAVFNSVFIFYL